VNSGGITRELRGNYGGFLSPISRYVTHFPIAEESVIDRESYVELARDWRGIVPLGLGATVSYKKHVG